MLEQGLTLGAGAVEASSVSLHDWFHHAMPRHGDPSVLASPAFTTKNKINFCCLQFAHSAVFWQQEVTPQPEEGVGEPPLCSSVGQVSSPWASELTLVASEP